MASMLPPGANGTTTLTGRDFVASAATALTNNDPNMTNDIKTDFNTLSYSRYNDLLNSGFMFLKRETFCVTCAQNFASSLVNCANHQLSCGRNPLL